MVAIVPVLLLCVFFLGLRGCRVASAPEAFEPVEDADVEVIPELEPEIVVHVAGAVLEPGVYSLPANSRVWDALEIAGGTTPEGMAHMLNLASPLEDGQRVYVPTREEVETGETGSFGVPRKVNINTADRRSLETLPGIGPALAQRIIDYRRTNGSFRTIDDLTKVSGIGPKTVERLKDLVSVK